MRDKSIDFIKGMLMWCVVYGHTINVFLGGIPHSPIWSHTFVRTFDMPFFMILSGYFLRKSLARKSAWSVTVNRIMMIFVPIVIWSLILGHGNVFNSYYFLWAVLVSGMICIVAHQIRCGVPGLAGQILELVVLVGCVIALHVIRVPWNLFYLFPFFVVGYYASDVNFNLSKRWYVIFVMVFVAGLCFWSGRYTPWHTDALAWRVNLGVIWIYAYRFALGIVGVVVMKKFFDILRGLAGVESFVVNVIAEVGKETLALYILQTILLETATRRIVRLIYAQYTITLSQSLVNFVGYVVAPVLSFTIMVVILRIVQAMKSNSLLKHMFGFKMIK